VEDCDDLPKTVNLSKVLCSRTINVESWGTLWSMRVVEFHRGNALLEAESH
jgi:hypothetical protein